MDVAGEKRRRAADVRGASAAGLAARDLPAEDIDDVLTKVRSLTARMRAEAAAAAGKPQTLAELGIVGVREVSERTPEQVMVG